SELEAALGPKRARLRSLPLLDRGAQAELVSLLQREPDIQGPDKDLALAIVELRLNHDELGQRELRSAARISALGQRHGMSFTRPGLFEYEIKAEMEAFAARCGMSLSFFSTVSTRGEILHNTSSNGLLRDGDLLLADYGAETPGGYAGDTT